MKGKIITLILGIILGLTSICDVHALENDSNLTTQYIDNTYAYHYKNGILRSYGKLPFRYQNGILVYCIEPDRVINHTVYNSTDNWAITGFSNDVKKKMELISYYGYEYPGHNSIRYYMATQELIWLYSDDYVKWMDRYSTDGSLGNQINIDAEKNEILRLVNSHDKVPSFTRITENINLKKERIYTDTNNVLNDFNIETNIRYEKNGNTFKIYGDKFGSYPIKFTKKANNNKSTTVYYYNGDSQMMASFGVNDIIESNMTINVTSVYLIIEKKDFNTKEPIRSTPATFKIKNLDTNTYVTENLKTGNGDAIILLNKGKYEIEEVIPPEGYTLSKEKIVIDINDDIPLTRGDYHIDFYNDKPTGKITINKTDDENEKLNGVEVGLFDKEHNKIDSLITSGNDYFDNLTLGTYYIKELNTLEGYILDDEEYKIDLEYVDQNTYVVEKDIDIVNKKIKCDIVYISSNKLKGIFIEVYDENNIKVFDGETNEEGIITISNLPYGKYIIRQIKVPKGYILNEDEYIFYVNDSTCNSKITVSNEKTIMPITTTKVSNMVSLALSLMGIGVLVYAKKNN